MVKHPSFKITANGKDVTESLRSYLVSIEYTDDIDDTADGFTISFQGKNFTPPAFSDVLKVWLGYEGTDLWYLGSFSVLKSRLEFDTLEVEITASPVNFGSDLKEKRHESFNNVTLDQILHKIASRHGLKVKNSFPKYTYTHKSHTHTSDIEFMRRLAKELGATFAIKNDTILFRPKNGTEQESELPLVSISAKELKELWFETLDKSLYASATASWHSTKENKTKRVTVGSGTPVLQLKGSFKGESDARVKAKAALEASNRGKYRGGFTLEGANIIAGAKININDLPQGWPSSFGIKQVRHSWGSDGYTISVEIEN